MNLKKIKIASVVAVISIMFFAGNAMAASGWAACTPKKIGPYGDAGVRIQVLSCMSGTTSVDPSGGQNGWMVLNTVGEDQQMAAILTAMSMGKPVSVHYDTTVKDSSGYVIADSILFIN